MLKITFKNLAKSELAREVTKERILSIVDKFEDLRESRIQVTLEMQNSPLQAGPDLFNVKVNVVGARYAGLRIEKSAPSLYAALADVSDHLLEALNRFGDKRRVLARTKARRWSQKVATQP